MNGWWQSDWTHFSETYKSCPVLQHKYLIHIHPFNKLSKKNVRSQVQTLLNTWSIKILHANNIIAEKSFRKRAAPTCANKTEFTTCEEIIKIIVKYLLFALGEIIDICYDSFYSISHLFNLPRSRHLSFSETLKRSVLHLHFTYLQKATRNGVIPKLIERQITPTHAAKNMDDNHLVSRHYQLPHPRSWQRPCRSSWGCGCRRCRSSSGCPRSGSAPALSTRRLSSPSRPRGNNAAGMSPTWGWNLSALKSGYHCFIPQWGVTWRLWPRVWCQVLAVRQLILGQWPPAAGKCEPCQQKQGINHPWER